VVEGVYAIEINVVYVQVNLKAATFKLSGRPTISGKIHQI